MTAPWENTEGDEPGKWIPESDWQPVPDSWPEYLAGPEYWLYKLEADDEPPGEDE